MHLDKREMTLQEAFRIFKIRYASSRVSQFENCLNVKCAPGKSDQCARTANELIRSLKLPLIAEGTTFHDKASFRVIGCSESQFAEMSNNKIAPRYASI